MNRKTVVMFVPSADGGMARYAWELLHALARHPRGDFRYELVSGEDLDRAYYSDRYAVQPILRRLRHRKEYANRAAWVAGRLTHYARREWQFLKWLKGRPDVVAVHLQEWTPWVAAPMLRRIRKMGKRAYYTVHNIRPHRYPAVLPKGVVNRWIRTSCRLCDGLFVHTDRLADQLSEFLDDRHPPIHVVPHGVWSVPDGIAAPPPLAERQSWKKLLFFGQIRRNKGLDILLRAAEQLKDYSITIAGEPHEAEYYRTEILPQVERLRAGGVRIDLRDRFVPESEVPALLATHSAVVMPYTQKFVAQSGVIFLALAHDLPVVASRAGGLKDLFEEFEVGVPFDDLTPVALAAAVRKLEDAKVLADIATEMSAAKQRYSWHEAAGATINGYLAHEPLRDDVRKEDVHDRAMATSSAQ